MKNMVIGEVKKLFNPEFVNRVDELVVFNPLGRDDIEKIVDLILAEVEARLREKNITVNISSKVKDFLIEAGYSPEFGARPLRRAVQRHVEDKLALDILSKKFIEGDVVTVDMSGGEITTAVTGDSILRKLHSEEKNEKDD